MSEHSMARIVPPNVAFQILKAALSIPQEQLLQKIVIEVDCSKIPTVYIKGLVSTVLIEAAAGLFVVKPVADVVVSEQGEVEAKLL